MNTGKTVFSQILDFFPWRAFQRRVQKYKGNYRIKHFSCADQLLCMIFAQLTFRDSLRDIEACLRSLKSKLYHIGIRSYISKSTLADANNTRDWRIYADIAQVLIHQARKLYANDDLGIDLDSTVYALDSTTITLCMSLFPWSKYSDTQSGIRMHTALDIRGSIPSFVDITTARINDYHLLDVLIPEPGSYYIMDRGYLSSERLYKMHQQGSFFIIRARKDIKHRRVYSRTVDKTQGLRCDQIIVFTGCESSKYYPDQLRKIRYYDKKQNRYFTFFTNNFALDAQTIADLYKRRWSIELFFKWIKQHLRIKKFYGTSENAVKTQIWIAITTYVLIAISKKRLNIDAELYIILQVLSVSAFEKIELSRLLNDKHYKKQTNDNHKQLELFN